MHKSQPPLDAHADISSGVGGLSFLSDGSSLPLHPNSVFVRRKAVASLHICAGSPEPSILDNMF